MKPLFTGTGTALITPFKNGEIDWDALDNLVESQIAGGVSALIAAGTTGEPSTMTWDEHIEVIRFVAERAKDRACVIAGTGSNCTREVIHAANVVKDFGVAAQLVVTPYYNKSTQEGLVAHYTEIAAKTSLPIVVYNVPSRTGVNIQPVAFLVIKDGCVRTIQLSDSSNSIDRALTMLPELVEKLTTLVKKDDKAPAEEPKAE